MGASWARWLVASLACACAPAPRVAVPSEARRPVPTRQASGPAAPDAPPEVPAVRPVETAFSYDLAADRARIVEHAREELGAEVRATVGQETFVLVATPGWNAGDLAASRELATGALDAYFNHRFRTRPAQAVAVYLFASSGPYQAYCKAHLGGPCLSKYGAYHPDRRLIVMNAGLGLGTLTHELVHPIVEADFPRAPTWINEGIASLFEAPVLTGPGEITGAKNWRLPRLRAALASKGEHGRARVDGLFGMSDASFRGDAEDLHYALARYVCQWLDENGWLFAFYQRWRDGVEDDPTGEKAFTAVVGRTPAAANEAWAKWVGGI